MPQTVPAVLKQENEIPSAAQDMEIGCLLYRNRENFAKEILSVCVFLQVAKEKKMRRLGDKTRFGEKRENDRHRDESRSKGAEEKGMPMAQEGMEW